MTTVNKFKILAAIGIIFLALVNEAPKAKEARLKPKQGIKKADKDLIKDQIKSGNLSQKEAQHYNK